MIGRFYRYINRNLGGSGKDRAEYDEGELICDI